MLHRWLSVFLSYIPTLTIATTSTTMTSQRVRSPYKGDQPKLVIAIDIGTTFSGASFAVLTPGQIPLIVDVTGYVM